MEVVNGIDILSTNCYTTAQRHLTAIVKTAISLDQELFAQVDELASSLKVSRSRVFALAAEDFVRRRRNAQITQRLNETYSDEAREEDLETVRQMHSAQRLAHTEW